MTLQSDSELTKPHSGEESFLPIGSFLNRDGGGRPTSAHEIVEPGSNGKEKAPPKVTVERCGGSVTRLTIRCACGETHVLELQAEA